MTVAIQPHRKMGDAAIERRHDLCRCVFKGSRRTEDGHDAIAGKALNNAALLAHGVIHQLRKAAH